MSMLKRLFPNFQKKKDEPDRSFYNLVKAAEAQFEKIPTEVLASMKRNYKEEFPLASNEDSHVQPRMCNDAKKCCRLCSKATIPMKAGQFQPTLLCDVIHGYVAVNMVCDFFNQ